MTLYDFNILELNERMEAVNQYGTFLEIMKKASLVENED